MVAPEEQPVKAPMSKAEEAQTFLYDGARARLRRQRRTKYVTLTLQRIRQADADEIVKQIVEKHGAVSIFVEEYAEPEAVA